MDVANVKIKDEPIDADYEEVSTESNPGNGVLRVKSEFTENASFASIANSNDDIRNLFDNPEDNEFLDEVLVRNVENAEEDDKMSTGSEVSKTEERIRIKEEKPSSSEIDSDALKAEIDEVRRRLKKRRKEFSSQLERQCLRRSRSRSRDRNHRSSSSVEKRAKRRYSRRKDYSYSRSRSRSRSSSRSLNRDYRNSKEYKGRSVSRERERDRDRRHRSRSKTRHHRSSRHGKRRSRSRERRAKDSFLNELPKILAEKGHSIPEEEIRSLLKSRGSNFLDYVSAPSTSYLVPSTYPQPAERVMYDESQFRSNTNTSVFPLPVRVKLEPSEFDYGKRISPERNSNNSALRPKVVEQIQPLIDQIKVEKVEETPEQRKEKVIKLCMEVIGKLSQNERNPITTRFFYTSTTVTKGMGIDENLENRSPLNRLSNVIFSFNSTVTNINLLEWGIIKLNDSCENVSRAMGISASILIDKLKCKESPFNKMENEKLFKSGKFYTPFYIDASVQTEENSCTTCIIRQLRKFTDKSVQAYPPALNTAVQTEAENDLPIMSIISTLNTAQLIALNDFAELLKGPPASSTNEIFRLRERLMDIYHIGQQAGRFLDPRQQQQSTSQFPSSFPQQQMPMMHQQQTPMMAQQQTAMITQQQASMMAQQQAPMMAQQQALMMAQQQTSMMPYANYNNAAGSSMGMGGVPTPVPYPHQSMRSNNFQSAGGMVQNMQNRYQFNTDNSAVSNYQRQPLPGSSRENRLPAIQAIGKRREDPRKAMRGANNVSVPRANQSIEGREGIMSKK